MFCLFVSHQWLGWRHPDPTGQKMEILRVVLRNIISGSTKVYSDLLTTMAFRGVTELSQGQCEKIADAWLWLDWFSIPQLSMCKSGEALDIEKQVQDAIWSIPAYADRCNIFLALCPNLKHADTHELCSRSTWQSRGWCRLEVAASAMGTTAQRPYVGVTSTSRVFLEQTAEERRNRVGLGAFTDPADKLKLLPVMEDIVDRHIEYLERRGAAAIVSARFIRAMRSNFLEGLPLEGIKEPEDDMPTFLERFRFNSATSPAECNFGPVLCAALAGNCKVLRELVAARADVNQQVSAPVRELSFLQGMNPLMFLAWSARGPETARVLLELRADLNVRTNQNSDALTHAARVGNLSLTQFFLDLGMDPEVRLVLGGTSVDIAALCGMPETLRLLLERRANTETRCFLGWTPLISASLFGHAACCQVLLDHSADLEARVVPTEMKGEVVLGLLRLTTPLVPSASPLSILGNLRGQTALSIAQSQGYHDIVEILEEATLTL